MIIQTSSPQQVIALDKEKKKGIVLIWFYAVWCGHCRDMEGEWEKLSDNHPDEIKLAKVESSNMSDYKKSPGEEELRGFPTIRLYKHGELIKEYDGERSFESIHKFVEDYLKEHKNTKKSNLMLVRARKNNIINGKLINAIIKKKKGTNKGKKKLSAKNSVGNKTNKAKKNSKKPKKKTKKKVVKKK